MSEMPPPSQPYYFSVQDTYGPECSILFPKAEWQRRRPRMLEDLSSREWDMGELPHAKISRAEVVIERSQGALLTWGEFFFVDHQMRRTYVSRTEHSARDVATNPQHELIYRSAGIRHSPEGFFIDPSAFSNHRHIDGRVMFGTSEEPANWGLWLLRTLTAANYYRKNRDKFDKFFAFAGTPSMREMLALMGIQDNELVLHEPWNSYSFDDVSYIRQGHRDHSMRDEQWPLYDEILNTIGRRGDAPKRIFVSRAGLPKNHYRAMINEDELAAFLTDRGFTVIDPGQMTASEQATTFHAADDIVGLGGAGMFNTVFCRPGTRVLDIESTAIFLPPHSRLFASRRLDYGMIVGEEDLGDIAGAHRRWRLDMERAVPLIDQFFG